MSRQQDRGRSGELLGKADLHIHTAAGDGSSSVEEVLRYVERHTDLDVVAITDHDEVAGSLKAIELARRNGYRFEVIPGLEVTTRDGHLLALFVEQRVPMLR
jgi:predicted metal-dependent phosphoesterase TrpH